LAVRELDQHRSSERQEGLGWIPIEDGLCLIEGPVRSDGGVKGRLSSVVVLDQDGTEATSEDSDGFFVDDLGHSFDLVEVHV
jgi:hypothetical protein